MKGRRRGSTQRGCRLTPSLPGSQQSCKAPERRDGEQAVSPRGFFWFDLDVRGVPFGKRANAGAMGLSGIRDKSLIASCKSLFARCREDKELSERSGEEGAAAGTEVARGGFSLFRAVGVACRSRSGSITGVSQWKDLS